MTGGVDTGGLVYTANELLEEEEPSIDDPEEVAGDWVLIARNELPAEEVPYMPGVHVRVLLLYL